MNVKLIVVFVFQGLLAGCGNFFGFIVAPSFVKDFFGGDIGAAPERMEGYSLEEQYQIFLYGVRVYHPPAFFLAPPIAKHGQIAADYILQILDTSSSEDVDYRDSMIVFENMQRLGYFNLCNHQDYLKRIKNNLSKIENIKQKEIYLDGLQRLGCEAE